MSLAGRFSDLDGQLAAVEEEIHIVDRTAPADDKAGDVHMYLSRLKEIEDNFGSNIGFVRRQKIANLTSIIRRWSPNVITIQDDTLRSFAASSAPVDNTSPAPNPPPSTSSSSLHAPSQQVAKKQRVVTPTTSSASSSSLSSFSVQNGRRVFEPELVKRVRVDPADFRTLPPKTRERIRELDEKKRKYTVYKTNGDYEIDDLGSKSNKYTFALNRLLISRGGNAEEFDFKEFDDKQAMKENPELQKAYRHAMKKQREALTNVMHDRIEHRYITTINAGGSFYDLSLNDQREIKTVYGDIPPVLYDIFCRLVTSQSAVVVPVQLFISNAQNALRESQHPENSGTSNKAFKFHPAVYVQDADDEWKSRTVTLGAIDDATGSKYENRDTSEVAETIVPPLNYTTAPPDKFLAWMDDVNPNKDLSVYLFDTIVKKANNDDDDIDDDNDDDYDDFIAIPQNDDAPKKHEFSSNFDRLTVDFSTVTAYADPSDDEFRTHEKLIMSFFMDIMGQTNHLTIVATTASPPFVWNTIRAWIYGAIGLLEVLEHATYLREVIKYHDREPSDFLNDLYDVTETEELKVMKQEYAKNAPVDVEDDEGDSDDDDYIYTDNDSDDDDSNNDDEKEAIESFVQAKHSSDVAPKKPSNKKDTSKGLRAMFEAVKLESLTFPVPGRLSNGIMVVDYKLLKFLPGAEVLRYTVDEDLRCPLHILVGSIGAKTKVRHFAIAAQTCESLFSPEDSEVLTSDLVTEYLATQDAVNSRDKKPTSSPSDSSSLQNPTIAKLQEKYKKAYVKISTNQHVANEQRAKNQPIVDPHWLQTFTLEIHGDFDLKTLVLFAHLYRVAKRINFVLHSVTAKQYFAIANWFVRERRTIRGVVRSYPDSKKLQKLSVQMHIKTPDSVFASTYVPPIHRGRLIVTSF